MGTIEVLIPRLVWFTGMLQGNAPQSRFFCLRMFHIIMRTGFFDGKFLVYFVLRIYNSCFARK